MSHHMSIEQYIMPLPFHNIAVAPVFHLSQYDTHEGGRQVVRLSAPILTRPQIPPFTGSIEVDITAEDLPTGDTRQTADFGKRYLSIDALLYYTNECTVFDLHQSVSNYFYIMLSTICISYLS